MIAAVLPGEASEQDIRLHLATGRHGLRAWCAVHDGIVVEWEPFVERYAKDTVIGVRWVVTVGKRQGPVNGGEWTWSHRWRYWADRFDEMTYHRRRAQVVDLQTRQRADDE